MNKSRPLYRIGNILLLAILLFLLSSFSFSKLQFLPEHFQNAGIFLLVALLDAAVLSLPILASRRGGWPLAGSLFLAFFAVSSLLVAAEAFYMSDVLSPAAAVQLLVDGAITAAIFAPAAVALHGRLREEPAPRAGNEVKGRPWWSWLCRLALAGVLYLIVYIACGSLIFQPLAYALDPVTAEAYLGDFAVENPMAILGFQALRGALWALLAVPLIACMARPRPVTGLAVALLFGVVMGLPNLVPNEILTPGLQVAHTVEVFTGNFLFGWAVVGLLGQAPVRGKRTTEATELTGTII